MDASASIPTVQPSLTPAQAAPIPVATHLPQIWPGLVVAGVLLILELSFGFLLGVLRIAQSRTSDVTSLSLWVNVLKGLVAATYLGGITYWFMAIHRIHKVLADASNHTYPITPGKAVGFQFIPIYCVYWNFKWPNQIAAFVNSHTAATKTKMSRNWLGVVLFLASMLTFVDRGIQLFVLFGIALYLVRKLTPWAPSEEAWDLGRTREWQLPVTAGAGATFGFLACYGLWAIVRELMAPEMKLAAVWIGAVVILMIACLLWFFVEPLFDLVKELWAGKQHKEEEAPGNWFVQAVLFVLFIVVVIGSHSLLESTFEQSSRPETIFVAIMLALLFFGVTYLLVIAATQKLTRALTAVIGGTALLAVLFLLAFAAVSTIDAMTGVSLGEAAKQVAETGAAGQVAAHEESLNLSLLTGGKIVLFFSVPFAAMALLPLRYRRGPKGVAFAGFLSALLVTLAGYLWLPHLHLLSWLWACTGWCIGILAFCEGGLLRPSEPIALAVPAKYHHECPLREEPHVRVLSRRTVLVLVAATLVIFAWLTPKLIIEAGAEQVQRYYGEPNPQLTALPLQGLQAGDTVEGEPLIWTDAVPTSPPGTYKIHIRPGSLKIKGKHSLDDYMILPREGTLTILPASSTVSLAPQATTVPPNKPVPLTATVSSPAGTPTGTVTFKEGSVPVATSAIANGAAAFPAGLALGQHMITAEYNADDGNFEKAASDPAQVSVIADYVPPATGTSISLTSSSPSARPNTPVTFTAKLQYDGYTPTGTITFKDNSNAMDTEPITDGVGSFTTSSLRPGTHSITAEFSGGGSSNALTENITLAMVTPNIQVITAGAPLVIRTIDPVDSTTARIGQIVHASVQAPPAFFHAPATLRVIRVDPSGKLTGHSSVTIELTSVTIAGRSYPVHSLPIDRFGPSKTNDTLKKTGIGAAIGGAVGGIFGHGKGAAIGAGAGAGVGAAAAATTPAGPAKIPSETILTFHLRSSLNLAGSQ